MLKSKKLLKLSRNGQTSQNVEKSNPDLDDSIDDFIVARPPKTERKLQKTSEHAKNQITGSEILISEAGTSLKSCDEAPTSSIASTSSKISDSGKISPYFGAKVNIAKEVNTAGDNTTSTSCIVAQKVTAQKKSSRKVGSKRGCPDPSDMALALALSESIHTAGEIERQNQEEMLLKENLVDVIAELRNEDATSEKLAPLFLKSPAQPVTKVKRKGKAGKKAKEYVLLMRTQTERERMIAEQAAAVLHQAADTCKEEKVPFIYTEPNSDLIKQYQQRFKTLWERTALVNDENSVEETATHFYVEAFRSVLSPPKKTGYTNILFHVSQLPGRGCSQVDPNTLTATQAVLEQLAFAAEGGFVDDPDAQKDQASLPVPSELVQDWSKMIDNPLMSDIRIKTFDKQIHAHRLVFAVRFPQLLDRLTQSTENSTYELDWADYSSFAVKKVLQFVYTADYEHDETIVDEVCHICRRFDIRALSERIPNHEQYSFLSSKSDDDAVNLDEEKLHNTTPRKLDSDSPKITKSGITQSKEPSIQLNEDANNHMKVDSASDSEIEELSAYLPKIPEKTYFLDKTQKFGNNTSEDSQSAAEPSFNAIAPQKAAFSIAETSDSKLKIYRKSLSPDMFQDTMNDSRCEEVKDPSLDASEVIDLTQDSGRSNSVGSSPLLSWSCQLGPGDMRKNDKDSVSVKVDPKLGEVIELARTDREESDVNEAMPTFVEACSYRETSPFAPIDRDSPKPSDVTEGQHSSERRKRSNELSPRMHSSDFDRSSFLDISVVSSKVKSTARQPGEALVCSSKTKSSKEPNNRSEKSREDVEGEPADIEQSILEKSLEASPIKYVDDSFPAWESCNDGVISEPFYPSPCTSSFSRERFSLNVNSPASNLKCRLSKEQSTSRTATRQSDLTPCRAPGRSLKSKVNIMEDVQTPDGARPAKKRKVDVTPLPNYQTMDTPGLKKELDKFGLKPMTRKNAVKLLNHIYEELHPLVTDSECSFQDTPERAVVIEGRQTNSIANSPSKSSLDRSSQEESENSLAEDEESMFVTELDRQNSLSPGKTQLPISLHDNMRQFFQKRCDLYKQVLTYEPIEFEFLYKEVRKDGIRCKAEELLDWLDQQCITCRMKARDRARKGKNQPVEGSHVSPQKTPEKAVKPTQGRRVAKKLIP